MKEFQAELPIGKAWNFESLFISFRCLHMYEENTVRHIFRFFTERQQNKFNTLS